MIASSRRFALVIAAAAPRHRRLPAPGKPAYAPPRTANHDAAPSSREPDPEPDLPTTCPHWLPRRHHLFPGTCHDQQRPFTAILDQLAAHTTSSPPGPAGRPSRHVTDSWPSSRPDRRLARLKSTCRAHRSPDQPDRPGPDGTARPAPAWWQLAASERRNHRPATGLVEQVYRPATAPGRCPRPAASTTCACTAESHPSCGRCCTSADRSAP